MLLDIILHLDQHLAEWANILGVWLYVILFLIIFAETGFVVTPFLPGDSLLFAVGALAAIDGSHLNIIILSIILMIAAILGDNVNYSLGRWFGAKLFTKEDSFWFKKSYLDKAQEFYKTHGAKAIVLARFAPLFRTFVPFVGGMGRMHQGRFLAYNVIGGVLWINIFLIAGYFFGNLPEVKRNFHIVIFAVILISLLPIFIEWMRHRKASNP